MTGTIDNNRKWKTDWKDWPALLSSFLILLTWLIASAILIKQNKILPLDYFTNQSIPHFNYNVLITFLGALSIIGWGISQGFKHIIRERTLSPSGLNLSYYEALNKMANQSILFKISSRAVGCFAVWILVSQFSTATQAAFGTSVVKYDLTNPIIVSRLSSAQNFLNGYLPTGLALPLPGDLVYHGCSSTYPDENGKILSTLTTFTKRPDLTITY